MTRVKLQDLKVNQTVYYIPTHLPKEVHNAEIGTVSTIRDGNVWVRYTTGSTGALTPLKNLYK